MNVTKNSLPKSQIELIFEVEYNEIMPQLENAATELAEQTKIEGFRPGKAPFEIVKQRLGEMAILQHAVNSIIANFYYDYIDKNKIETIDQPQIEIIKMAPNNPFSFKAVAALLPNVELCDYKNLKAEKIPEIKIEKEEVDKVINDLRKMRVTEALVEREAKMTDRAEINFETFIDGIAIAGGKAEKYAVVLGENQMIEGFEENLVGLKKDDEKEFELTFPKKYHNEKIAGKKAKFKVKMLAVFEMTLPEVNDELAKTLGLKDLASLNAHIEHSLKHDKETTEIQKQELNIVNQLIEKSKFGDLPDVLITQETHKMVHELEENVAMQGLEFDDYLRHLNKTIADLKLDFVPDAIKRVQTALAIRQIAIAENISANEEEIHAEIDRTLKSYQLNPAYAEDLKKIEENITTEASHRYFANIITNRKVIEFLKKENVK